jgi:hypothetical protein
VPSGECVGEDAALFRDGEVGEGVRTMMVVVVVGVGVFSVGVGIIRGRCVVIER